MKKLTIHYKIFAWCIALGSFGILSPVSAVILELADIIDQLGIKKLKNKEDIKWEMNLENVLIVNIDLIKVHVLVIVVNRTNQQILQR